MQTKFSGWLLAGLLCCGLRAAEQPDPVAALPATEFDAKVQEQVSQFEAIKEPEQAQADLLVKNLSGLGRSAEVALLKAAAASSARKSLATAPILAALIRIQAQFATPVLVKILASQPDAPALWNVLLAIKETGNSSAIPEVLKQAVAVFNRPPKTVVEQVQQPQTRDLLVATLRTLGLRPEGARQLASGIANGLGEATAKTKYLHINVLEAVPGYAAQQLLLQMANDIDKGVRNAAIAACGPKGTPDTAVRLAVYLNGGEPKTLTAACMALGQIKFQGPLPQLLPLLKHTDLQVRQSAAWALRQITGKPFLEDASAWQSWYEAAQKEAELGLQALKAELASGPRELLPVAIESMPNIVLARDKMLPVLQPFLADADPRVRAAACNALAQTGSPFAKSLLFGHLSDPALEVSYSALRGLRCMTGENMPMDAAALRDYLEKNP